MRLHISHLTRYRYTKPVMLSPHTFRVRPRTDAYQRVLDCQVVIRPEPVGLGAHLDAEGNYTHSAWFVDSTQMLEVEVVSEVETQARNSFSFLLEPGSQLLPLDYGPESELLRPYRHAQPPEPAVEALARRAVDQSGGHTVTTLVKLNQTLHQECRNLPFAGGAPRPASATWAAREGSCRDLAWLFIQAARSLGLAARYVTGFIPPAEGEETLLHAWAEVYLPGAGWRGFDTSNGLLVDDRHVALAAARTPMLATPVLGRFAGQGAASDLTVRLSLERQAE